MSIVAIPPHCPVFGSHPETIKFTHSNSVLGSYTSNSVTSEGEQPFPSIIDSEYDPGSNNMFCGNPLTSSKS